MKGRFYMKKFIIKQKLINQIWYYVAYEMGSWGLLNYVPGTMANSESECEWKLKKAVEKTEYKKEVFFTK